MWITRRVCRMGEGLDKEESGVGKIVKISVGNKKKQKKNRTSPKLTWSTANVFTINIYITSNIQLFRKKERFCILMIIICILMIIIN